MHRLRAFAIGVTVSCAAALYGCSGGGNSTGSIPAPASTSLVNPQNIIAVPGVPPTTGTFSFDISFVDNSVQQYYLADRTTAGVDVVSTTSLSFLRTAGAGQFTGVVTTPNASGPNGVVSIGNGIVFAGDGNSTLKVVNTNSGAVLASIPTVNPVTSGTLPCGHPTTGTANVRVDEMAYDPTDGIVLAINDAACPSFGTFFSTTAPYSIVGTVAFPTAYVGGATGVEQPTWDPTQGKFLVAIPGTTTNTGGEVDVIDPHSHAVTNVFPVPGCAPNGTALGPNETLFLGCTGQELLTINAATGATINTIAGIGGADEVYYGGPNNRFYCGCSNNTSALGPVLAVADSGGNLISTTPTQAGSHSVAVDAAGHVYVPERSNGIVLFK